MSLLRRDKPRRPRVRYGPAILAGLVLVGLIIVGKMARTKFEWWQESAFVGQVVGKEARSRADGESVEAAAALGEPAKCRFYLHIRHEGKAAAHEVIPSLFQTARVGDHVTKKAGTYRWVCVPGVPVQLQPSTDSPTP